MIHLKSSMLCFINENEENSDNQKDYQSSPLKAFGEPHEPKSEPRDCAAGRVCSANKTKFFILNAAVLLMHFVIQKRNLFVLFLLFHLTKQVSLVSF